MNITNVTTLPAKIHWTFDDWATIQDVETRDASLNCWFPDLSSEKLDSGTRIIFTFLWKENWEQKDFQVSIA